ncbi:TetR family transcriptional regulator [Rhodoplanes azumiensis]|uniref:TetR family transcriptional regulator n=1 Tax=Rhodoplanes azumiensis TaxID=1897628 RepID=A0ABW5AFK5_9BRAD
MARKPGPPASDDGIEDTPESGGRQSGGATGQAGAGKAPGRIGTPRGKVIEAFMALLAEQPYETIGLRDIAARAGVSLAELRGQFSGKLAILAAHIKEIDREVLNGDQDDMSDEPTRERLFDVLMRRFEALAPYKGAIRSLLQSARTNPPLALALNNFAVNAMQWMLAGAEIRAAGPTGLIRAQGLALLYANVMSTFLDDDEPGHARTMAALDRALGRGQQLTGVLDRVCGLIPGCGSRRRPRPARPADLDGDAAVAV